MLSLVVVALAVGAGGARADFADSNDPLPLPGAYATSASFGLVRGGYATGTTEDGASAGVAWLQGASQGFWVQGPREREAAGASSDLPPFARSILIAVIGDTEYELPLSPASVIYDPVFDRYEIDAATEGCQVRLTLAAPSQDVGFTTVEATAGGVQATADKRNSADPWIYTGSAGSWTGAAVYTYSAERRTYSGTVCGKAVSLPGDLVFALLSQFRQY